MRGKGGKAFKATTSRKRKIKRVRDRFRWPQFDAERLSQDIARDALSASPASDTAEKT